MKSLNVSKPVNKPKITSKYGFRILNGKPQFHNGIDLISIDFNNSVYSIFDGKVVYDFDNYIHELRFLHRKHSGGNYVIIQSIIDNELYFLKYLHLKENYVKLNEQVKAGDRIGVYDDVGYSFGAHLHLSIYDHKWNIINPMKVLKKYEVL